MSTTIFKFRIARHSERLYTSEELLPRFYTPGILADFITDWAERLDIDPEDTGQSFTRFRSILKERYQEKGEAAIQLIMRLFGDSFVQLRKSYQDNEVDELVSCEAVLWNNALAEIGVPGFRQYPITEITLDIVQVEDGIRAFPDDGGIGVQYEEFRDFMIRTLSTIDYTLPAEQQPIWNWFIRHGGDICGSNYSIDYGDSPVDGEGIVWGLTEHERLKIEPYNEAFWKAYADTWWVQRIGREYLTRSDEEYPLRAVTYDVFIHPAWFKNIREIIARDEIYDSTAW